MRSKYALLFVVLTSIIECLNAQDKTSTSPVILGAGFSRGFLLNHSPKSGVNGLSLGPVNEFELDVLFQTNGKKKWHYHYHFPYWGFSLNYFDLQQTIIPCSGVSLLIHSTFKLIQTPRFEWNVRIGTGIGHFNNLYSPDKESKDNKNLWLSAQINGSLYMHMEALYRFNSHWSGFAGWNYNHYSNGATSMPNLGINLISTTFGLRYSIAPAVFKRRLDTVPDTDKKHIFHVSGAFGIKKLPDFGTIGYPTYTVSVQYSRKITRFSRLVLGLDGFYNTSLKDSTWRANPNRSTVARLGAFVGHEWVLGKLSMLAGMGLYLYKNGFITEYISKPNQIDAPAYIRAGLRYHFCPNFFAAVFLKTHWAQADNIEWTVGYTFW